jgi:lipoprotein-releasing system ATP-binding protein
VGGQRATTRSEIVLRASGLGRTFEGTNGEIVVLRGVELDVARAEVVGILGASGVGKSTLLHILGSLDRPDDGTVTVDDVDIHTLKGPSLDELRNRKLGFVFQFHFLLPEFTALENVMMPALVGGRSASQASAVAREWLDKVGLTARAGHRPGELSGGEQQRVAVARALVNDPEVVLADEPTGNLDFETGEEIHRLIRRLADDEKKSFVVVTHKRAFVEHADRVLLLADGRLAPMEK